MQIVKGDAVCPILRARRYKAGRIWRVLRKLLGNGLILAEGEDHIHQRQQIGAALRKIPQAEIDAAVQSFLWPDVGARADLAKLMMSLIEHIMRRVLFGTTCGAEVGSAIRSWLRLMPLHLLGLPVGRKHLRRLDAALAMQVADAVVRVYTQTMCWQPVFLDLQRKPGLTNWPWKAIVERTA